MVESHSPSIYKARSLNRTHLELLASIPGISIENSDDAWEKTCAQLRSWPEKHHSTNDDGSKTLHYPHRVAEDKTEQRFAIWLQSNRRWQKQAHLTTLNFEVEARQKHLEALPGWRSVEKESQEREHFQCAGTCGQMLARESFTDSQWSQGARRKCIQYCGDNG